jgi:hypothetical protein
MAAHEHWGIVEIMGHRQRAGRLSDVQRFGISMMQIEIPTDDEGGFRVEYYSGGSIFAFRECTEEQARAIAKMIAPPPEHRLLLGTGDDDDLEDREVPVEPSVQSMTVDGELDEPGVEEPCPEDF